MCGFGCSWWVGDPDLAAEMIQRIAHRLPDAVEVISPPGLPVTTAHCRLSIIGLEDGAQPTDQGDDILVVNGEIDNHGDLRGYGRSWCSGLRRRLAPRCLERARHRGIGCPR